MPLIIAGLIILFNQFLFSLSDEHLLIIVLFLLVSFIIYLVSQTAVFAVQTEQAEICKQVIKQELLKRLFIEELENQVKVLESSISLLVQTVSLVIEQLPDLLVDLHVSHVELRFQSKFSEIMDFLVDGFTHLSENEKTEFIKSLTEFFEENTEIDEEV
jgi:methionine synthase II (cobalamin-independent)